MIIQSSFLQVLSETSSSRPGGYRLFSSSRPPTEMKQSGLGKVFQCFSPVGGKGCLFLRVLLWETFIMGIGSMQSVKPSDGMEVEDEGGEATVRCELKSQMIVHIPGRCWFLHFLCQPLFPGWRVFFWFSFSFLVCPSITSQTLTLKMRL